MADGNFSDIERRVADDRAALARSLDLLSDTVAPDRLKAEAKGYGGEIASQLWDATRENPAAFALVGAGLALMLTGTGRRGETDAGIAPRAKPAAVPPDDAMDGFDTRVAAADAAMRGQETGREISAHRLRLALNRGLDKLPPDARARVLDARRRAIAAQEALERRAAKAGAKAERMVRGQPIAVAGAAFGIGALLAALLPSTRREDELMGAERDALMDDAGAALAREIEALRNTVGGSGPKHPRKPGQAAQHPVP